MMKNISLSKKCVFPIPFATLTPSQLTALQTIHLTRTSEPRSFVGQVELTPRLTIMVLCYMLKQTATLVQLQPANYFMLVKTEERRKQLLIIINKLVPFVMGWLRQEQKEQCCGSIKVYGELERYQEHHVEGRNRSDKKSGRLFILTSRTYLNQKIRIKQQEYWEKDELRDMCVHLDKEEQGHFHRASKKIQFLLVETNDLAGILQDIFMVHLGQAQITRAWMECNKLHKFYHDRYDKKKIQNMKKQVQDMLKERANKGNSLGKENKWRIEKYDEVFNKLAERRLASLRRTQFRAYADRGQQLQFMECQLLMNLQTVIYLCNHLMAELHSAKYQDYLKAQQYLNYLQDSRDASKHNNTNRPCLKRSTLKKLRRVLLKLTTMYPPSVRDRRVSTFYLFQVLGLFEKLVVWHEIFSRKVQQQESGFVLLRYLKEMNPTAKEDFFHTKLFKEQQFRLTTYDTHLLLELLQEGVKSSCIFQAHAYAKEYLQETALVPLPLMRQLDPVSAQQIEENQMRGIIVHCTANDQELYINSYKLEQKEKDDTMQPEERREAGQHYWQLIRTFGVMLFDICTCAQDGIVVYFPSREVMKDCRAEWEAKQNIYERIYHQKTIFEESQQEQINRINVEKYRKLCDMGRGAVYFLSAQSQMGKYQTFNGHYSRVIVFIGVPYPEIPLQVVSKFRHNGVKTHDRSKMHMLCFRQAMVAVARCLSNCGNDSSRLKPVVFADNGFRSQKVIPKWFPLIKHGSLNSSTVVEMVGEYLKKSIAGLNMKQRVQTYLALLAENKIQVKRVEFTVNNDPLMMKTEVSQFVVKVVSHLISQMLLMRESIIEEERIKKSEKMSYHPDEKVQYRQQIKEKLIWSINFDVNGQNKQEEKKIDLLDLLSGNNDKLSHLLTLRTFIKITSPASYNSWQAKIISCTIVKSAKNILCKYPLQRGTSMNQLQSITAAHLHNNRKQHSEMANLAVSLILVETIRKGEQLKIIDRQNQSIFQIGEQGRELRLTVQTPPLLKIVKEDEKGNHREWIEGIIQEETQQQTP